MSGAGRLGPVTDGLSSAVQTGIRGYLRESGRG